MDFVRGKRLTQQRSLVQCCSQPARVAPVRELSGEKWTPPRVPGSLPPSLPPSAFHLSLRRTLRRVHFGSNHISSVEGYRRRRGKTFPIEAFCRRRAGTRLLSDLVRGGATNPNAKLSQGPSSISICWELQPWGIVAFVRSTESQGIMFVVFWRH